MCWRDNATRHARLAELRSDQRRLTLERADAEKGCKVHTATYSRDGSNRLYFRRDYLLLAGGLPSDTVEVILPVGAKVIFTSLPGGVREDYRLKAKLPIARVVKWRDRVGFRFGNGVNQTLRSYYPLTDWDRVRFTVKSIPKKKKRK